MVIPSIVYVTLGAITPTMSTKSKILLTWGGSVSARLLNPLIRITLSIHVQCEPVLFSDVFE